MREIKSRRLLRDRWRTILHSACGLSNLVLAAINSRIGLDRGLSNPAKQQYTERQCEEDGEGNGLHFRDAPRDTPSAGCSSRLSASKRFVPQTRTGQTRSPRASRLLEFSCPAGIRAFKPSLLPFVTPAKPSTASTANSPLRSRLCPLSPRSLPPSQNFLGTRINADFIMRATNTQP